MAYCYGRDARLVCHSHALHNRSIHYRAMEFRQVLTGVLLGLGLTSTAWCAPWATDLQGNIFWANQGLYNNLAHIWNTPISDAVPDGSGGIVLAETSPVVVDGAAVPMTMTEASSAAEVAAGVAFLPEAMVYSLLAAGLAGLIWDAANQTYEIPSTPTSNSDPVCADGSTPPLLAGASPATYNAETDPVTYIISQGVGIIASYPNNYAIEYMSKDYGSNIALYGNCNNGANPIQNPLYGKNQDIPPSQLPPYILPWLRANPAEVLQLAQDEASQGHPPESSPPVLSGPQSTSLPPTTTTTTNPDGSKTTTTVTPTINWTYSGPNASGSTQTVMKTSNTPAPTASDPNPSPIAGPTTSSTASAPSASSVPQSSFIPPGTVVPTVPPVPPGVINLPIPNIDNTTGTCPAPITLNLGLPGLQTVTWDLTPWCTLATNLRPLVLTASALAAAFLLVR